MQKQQMLGRLVGLEDGTVNFKVYLEVVAEESQIYSVFAGYIRKHRFCKFYLLGVIRNKIKVLYVFTEFYYL